MGSDCISSCSLIIVLLFNFDNIVTFAVSEGVAIHYLRIKIP